MPKPYYDDGLITIYHGDCLDVMPELEAVDLVLTDPPYGINENNKRNLTRGKLAPARDYGAQGAWDRRPIDQATFDQLIAKGREAIIWGGNFYQTPASSCWLVWDKCLPSGVDFADCELAFTTLPGAVRKFTYLWSGFRQEPGTHRQIREHLCEKPIPLLRWCLGLAPRARSVLDPFMGSGTTLRAAKDLGLRATGIELEERYCEVAARRMAQEALPFDRVRVAAQLELIEA
jgi:site-specific DNA-methyltransferase (adenine-specific)